ncbi:MAG: class I SAM-dependent rRNA methyltransferase [Planctomycetota bacterium]
MHDREPKARAPQQPRPAPVPEGTVQLNARATSLWRRGQPWYYADDLVGPVAGADLAAVYDFEGRACGLGFTSTTSKLALRACGSWPEGTVPDRSTFFASRLQAAIERRAGQLGPEDGARLVHGEADDLPGLVVDRYGPVLVLQVTAPYVEASLDAIVPFLAERLSAEAVLARNDVAVRKLEHLPQEVRLLHGKRIERVAIVENGLRHLVEPFTGHKTGFYLDQRPARALVREIAKGRSVLDLFSYQGAFSLSALKGGAKSALAVDQSERALQLAQQAAEHNGLEGLSTERANVFDFLRGLRESDRRFDLIVLDPPAFAKSKREIAGALRGYRDLNRQALRLLAPHGWLVTCSCSHHMSLPAFEDVARQAAAGLPFKIALHQRLGAGSDHPVWLSMPESEYLKTLLLRRMD